MKFVVVTGMSGGGKTTVLKMLEDMGFYCVDNLPVSLIEKFAELTANPAGEISKVALGIDVRSQKGFSKVPGILKKLKQDGYDVKILFLESKDATLLKRYKESRRVHPLNPAGRVEDGILQEREILREIKGEADYIIDTSNLLTRELKTELSDIFIHNKEYNSLIVNIMSFGFKYGIPADADLVFDVRFLPNPFYIDELKHKTGLDAEVREYVMGFPEADEFLKRLTELIQFLIPNYIKEGKNQLVIGIGCTGGKHRSVTLASGLYNVLKDQGAYGIKLYHRDVTVGV